ncbi:glycosyl transferase [Streptomyces somaliensis DSM 40738]|uniref:glycosyltransferase n=1 Tax=Streptomyces somaliensis TaxID=78355 RepID=UPI0021C4AD48|nr:glycosyltransferase [Streptomyces somaliensis]MCQ0025592.1 glycosyl transferase [Streptomyces somaliensis DSM 40738]
MIGYYVHHQGMGHLHRARCVARRARTRLTGLSSLPRPADWDGEWIRLPSDTSAAGAGTDIAAADPTAHGRLHWVPRHHAGLRSRMAAVADWIERTAPALLVSDVSVEVAVLARLMGVPVVVCAMRGDRSDAAHGLAYDLADALLAPWPAALPEPDWPQEWRAKTEHTGAFSRHDGRPRPDAGSRPGGSAAGRDVLLMLGAGGSEVTATDLRTSTEATPGWNWTVLGGPGGWTDDPWPLLCRADVVVTHAGQNAVAECAAARVPTVVVPQSRPHGEQHATARALAAGGLAAVRDRWPEPGDWPGLLDEAVRTGGQRWGLWAPGDGAERAARLLDRLASQEARTDPDAHAAAPASVRGTGGGGTCASR